MRRAGWWSAWLLGVGLTLPGHGVAQTSKPAEPVVTEVAAGLSHPWSLAFLPDGRMLVTERAGRLRLVDKAGKVSAPITGMPAVHAVGQGGLLDLALSPNFGRDHTIFFSYSEADPTATLPNGSVASRTVVGRARLDIGPSSGPGKGTSTRLSQRKVIFRQSPSVGGGLHFGSRLVFGRDGNLWVTLGERYSQRARAQQLDNTLGKVVRIRPDGSIPADNPFVKAAGARPEIWSYGHRNVQGAALNPTTGQLWTVEHGARGGDEVNLDLPGRNYGWPVITWGIDYDGSKIGEGTTKEGMEQPLRYWVPSISPSGALFYTGDKFPSWRGSLLVGGLSGRLLSRLSTHGDTVTGEERLLSDPGLRVRDVRQGPDGYVYLLTDAEDGKILKLTPPQ